MAQDLGGIWAEMLPTNKEEALFIAQLLCDGGINKYNLSCGGLTKNLLNDFTPYMGLMDQESLDAFLEDKIKRRRVKTNSPPLWGLLF